MSEENSNFDQLLKLRARENPEIIEWLRKRDEKYTSPEIQNELLETMALGMMRQISANIQNATFFTIIAYETAADVSKREQLVIRIWSVDDYFVIHEDFIGMHPLEKTNADQVLAILKNALLINLNIQRARRQCYNGAAMKADEKTGVATQIKTIKGKCLYTHCYGHASNLAVADAIKSVQCISDSLDTVREIRKLIRESSQRNTKLGKIRAGAIHFTLRDGLCVGEH